MRISGFVVTAVLLLSVTLMAQHSAGSGGSSGGASHSSSFGGFSSAASPPISHNGGGSSSSHAGAGKATITPTAKVTSNKQNAGPEKKGFFASLRHPFQKPVVRAEVIPVRCAKAPCAVCPPGESRNGVGGCVVASAACPAGRSWNGLGCGTQFWFNDCSALQAQLQAERLMLQEGDDPGEGLRYQSLLSQYESCVARFGADPFSLYDIDSYALNSGFGAYAFNGALALDTP